MRILGIDLGSKRIGLAISDTNEVLASPCGTLERTGSHERDHRNIVEVIASHDAELVVIGMPISMDGTFKKAAHDVLAEVNELKASLAVPVYLWDERLSTKTASSALREAGYRALKQRSKIDQAAATVILQSFLDRRSQRRSQRSFGTDE